MKKGPKFYFTKALGLLETFNQKLYIFDIF